MADSSGSPGVVSRPADMLAADVHAVQPLARAVGAACSEAELLRLSLWKARYEARHLLMRRRIDDPDHAFADHLAFQLWLVATGRREVFSTS